MSLPLTIIVQDSLGIGEVVLQSLQDPAAHLALSGAAMCLVAVRLSRRRQQERT